MSVRVCVCVVMVVPSKENYIFQSYTGKVKGKFTVVRSQGRGKWNQDWGNSEQIRLGRQADTKSSNV